MKDGQFEERLHSVKNAAERLGISKRTVFSLIQEGILPMVKMGPRATRIRESDLRHLMEHGTKP